jgi:alkylation response protein AidB-like acyl-CoA dehydrogenase
MLSAANVARNDDSIFRTLHGIVEATASQADSDGRPLGEALEALRTSSLPGTSIPRRYGGQELSAVEANRRIQALARTDGSLAIILFQHLAVSARIAEWGTDEQKERLLPALARGSMIAASAWSEAGAGADKRKLSTTATDLPNDRFRIDGAKTFTTGAGLADLYLVLTQSDAASTRESTFSYGTEGQSFFLIEARAPGLTTDSSLDLFGMRSSATGFVQLENCVVEGDALLGPRGQAPRIIVSVRESGITLGAVSSGLARRAWDIAHGHAAKRGLLGQDVVRYRLVELQAQAELAQAVVERAGGRESENPGNTTLLSKIVASEASERACELARQILGSAGYTRPHPINRVARDASAIALMGPTNDLCRDIIGRSWAE